MNYTTIEQSKKLLELGLNPESADMLYTWDIDNKTYYPLPIIDDKEHDFPSGLSCWSIGALSEIVKCCNHCETSLRVDNKWNISAIIGDNIFDSYRIKLGGGYDNLFDAYYDVVVWLLVNGYLKEK